MSKREIIPAILEKDFKAIEKKIKILEKSFLKKERSFFVQIDICDGSLTPEKTFLSNGRKDSFEKLKKISKTFFLELDLIMDFKKIKNKKSFFKNLKSTGAKRVVFHNQGVQNWKEIFEFFEKEKVQIGMGIWLSEKNSDIAKILEKYDFSYVQIMGIEKVGFGGQKISEKVFKKAKFFYQNFPKITVQIDGGVKTENSKKLSENGVSRFVSGSGFFSAKDLKKRFLEF